MVFTASTSLSVTLAHAISYLTRPLIVQYSATTIIKLQLVLEANLTALYAPTWVPKEPLRGSGRRCLTLSPQCLPPRVIYSACLSSGVQWFDWISLLGAREFDFFVDPGCISVRHGRKGSPNCELITVWADEVPSPSAPTLATKAQSRTIAQQLMESETDEEEQIFAMIAHETKPSAWVATSLDKLTIPATVTRSSSPFSTDSSISASSSHSRSSSRSSNSSSGFSHSFSSTSSDTTVSSTAPSPSKQSRRERARQARVFIDTSKTDVTPYDGGKTTVLTGGVMLGGSPPKGRINNSQKANNAPSAAQQWRAIRV
ncbi:hypothetical protein C8J55DRAFT_557485 [Lentinula edodes]|uniref:Anti-proliferative protein domain-containing protein n=1 Tax=Lentinula lateritia TaxID=40482 RepID=A0A9W9DWQ1_9AGAR|nr:hypothetical protein C8J55DRAFT_557485 [Lentinula edodes]